MLCESRPIYCQPDLYITSTQERRPRPHREWECCRRSARRGLGCADFASIKKWHSIANSTWEEDKWFVDGGTGVSVGTKEQQSCRIFFESPEVILTWPKLFVRARAKMTINTQV